MPLVSFDQNPKIGDTVQIQFGTTDVDGNPFNPYKVNNVTIYYLDRGIASSDSFYEFTDSTGTLVTFANAIPAKSYGSNGTPAWLSPDTTDALIQKIEFDPSGNELTGIFEVDWTPDLNREGD